MVLTIHNGARNSEKVIGCVGERHAKGIAAMFTDTNRLPEKPLPFHLFKIVLK